MLNMNTEGQNISDNNKQMITLNNVTYYVVSDGIMQNWSRKPNDNIISDHI
jgi:hypothetical protein